jgi:4-hydroxy-2-oxoglutarate aldolase
MSLSGVLAPVPTPVDADDRVRPDVLRARFGRWLTGPLSGFVVLGSNGEAPLLDEGESDAILASARESIPRDRLFIAGTGRESTSATIDASRRAARLGADMVIVRTPGFFKSQMTHDVFVRHYHAVADASPVPVVLYNFTAVTGVNLPVRAVAELASHPNIAGIKESGGDIAQMADLVGETPDDFAVLAGSSGTFYAALCVGAAGGILALANVVPEPCVQLFRLVREGRHAEARGLQRRLLPLGRLLGTHGVAGLKAALGLLGCDVGQPRAPLTALDSATVTALRSAIEQFQEISA